MKIDKYLIVNSRGNVSVRERQPRIQGNEIALRLVMEIPGEIFERPIIRATLKIPTESIPKVTIDTEVTHNIENIIKQVTGLEMVVSLVEHEKKENERN